MVCTNCGIVLCSIIDRQQEWRFYGSEDSRNTSDPTRCGLPINPLLPNASLGTIILGHGYEVYRKIQKWNSITYKERSLINVFNNISAKSKDNNIPNCIVDKASLLYKILSDDKIKRGTSRKGLIAACVYYSLKDKEITRSTKEIAKLFGLSCKKMSTGCKEFNEMIFNKDNKYSNNIKPTLPEDFILRFVVLLKIDNYYRDIILNVAIIADNLGIITKNTPTSIAIGSIYLVSEHYNLGFTKKILKNKCNSSEVTISKAYKELNKYKEYLIPK